MVLAHVEVLEALDTWMIDGHQFLYETHVHLALLDVEKLFVHYPELAIMRLVASLRRDPNQACLARIRALQKHQVLKIHIDGF